MTNLYRHWLIFVWAAVFHPDFQKHCQIRPWPPFVEMPWWVYFDHACAHRGECEEDEEDEEDE